MRNSKKDVTLHAMGNCQEFFWYLFHYNSIEMYSNDLVTNSSR